MTLARIRNVWRPANFHYHRLLSPSARRPERGCFEGWYFKLVDEAGAQPCAIIPGVFLGRDPHAFVQVLDGRRGRAAYHRFDLAQFSAASDRFDVCIGPNRFCDEGIDLDLDGSAASTDGKVAAPVTARVRFGDWSRWPSSTLSPGVMGPFGLVPFMECYHGVLSVDHGLSGHLALDGQRTSLDGGRGYIEKDWGRGFPSGYVWAQSNHFERSGVSVIASVARIPWLGTSFRGFLAALLVDGTLHRFATYTGARVERCEVTDTHARVVFADRRLRLSVDAERSEGALLKAPYERQMLERVAETMRSVIDVRLVDRGGKTLFEGRGRYGGLEAQGDLAAITGQPG